MRKNTISKMVCVCITVCLVIASLTACSKGERQSFTCTDGDSHAIETLGKSADYNYISVTKTGDSDGDEADFTGSNAAVYAENGGKLNINDAEITTEGSHANAVFAYGEKSTVNISNSIIRTSKNNSGGIMVTGGGSLNANDLDVETKGSSSAAIRSDRGGGTMNVDGGTYKSTGKGSPAIYSTAEISVSNAKLCSEISEAVVIEGKNSVKLDNVDASGKNSEQNSDNTSRAKAVMIYQSMSGDASEGKGSFEMSGGSLSSLEGGLLYVTNTIAEIKLSEVKLDCESGDLLWVEKSGWGNDGSNGGQVDFTAEKQTLEGNITVDDISRANIYLKEGSSFEGSITSDGETYVELEEGSTWKLTGDSNIQALSCDENAIDLNGYKLTVCNEEYKAGSKISGQAVEFEQTAGGFEDGEMPPEPPEGRQIPSDEGQDGPDGQMPPKDGQEPPKKPDER